VAEASAVVTGAVAVVGVAWVAAADVLAAHRDWRAETTGEAGKEEEEVTAAATLAVEVRVAAEGAMAMAAVETVVALRVMEAQVEAGPEAEASAVETAAVAQAGVARVAAADVLAAHREWRAETTGEAGKEVEEAVAMVALAVEVRVAAEETAGTVMEVRVVAGLEVEALAVVMVGAAEVGVARVAAADVLAAIREWWAETTGVAGPAEEAPVTAAVSEGAAAGLVKLLKATAEGSLTMEAVVGYFQVDRASVHR